MRQGVNRGIVVRWLETVPIMLPVPAILRGKAVAPSAYKDLSAETLERICSTASMLTVESLGLPEPSATHFASCVTLCASPAYAFYQRCMAPEDHSLEVLAQHLAACAGAFPHAAVAHQILVPRGTER